MYVLSMCCLLSMLMTLLVVRVEWAKALAWKTRWCEEVNILCEKIKCTSLSLQFEVEQWCIHAIQDDFPVGKEI